MANGSSLSLSFEPLASNNTPPTRLGTRNPTTGVVDLSTIAWDQVALLEPEHVVEWLYYLHRHQSGSQVLALLTALSPGLGNYTNADTSQWEIYAQTGLSHAILDILIEPDMFSCEDNAFSGHRPCAIIISCDRLLCATEPDEHNQLFFWMRVLQYVSVSLNVCALSHSPPNPYCTRYLLDSSVREDVMVDLALYAGEMNFIAAIGIVIITSTQHEFPNELGTAIFLCIIIRRADTPEPIEIATIHENYCKRPYRDQIPQFENPILSTTRVWHDTLRSLSTIQT